MSNSDLARHLLCKFKDDKQPIFQDADGIKIYHHDLFNSGEFKFFSLLKNKLVLCLCENSIDFLQSYLRLLNVGATPILLEASATNKQVKEILVKYRPNVVLLPTSHEYAFDKVKEEFATKTFKIIFLDEYLHDLNKSLSMLLTTSGSTGNAKLVRLSTENLLQNSLGISRYLSITNKDVAITSLPLSYSYGLSIVHSHLCAGATISVTNASYFSREFWDFFKASNVTNINGVPYHFEILEKLKFQNMKLPSLRFVTQAGGSLNAPLQKRVVKWCHDKNIKYYTMYGQTEAAPRISYVPFERASDKIGSIGIPIENGELSIIGHDNKKISESYSIGEIIYRGPNVALGYAKNLSDLGLNDQFGGQLQTGDIGYFDDDGYFYITGRKSRFVKLLGNRCNLDDIEKFASEHGYDIACVGLNDQLQIFTSCSGTSHSQIISLLQNYVRVSPSMIEIVKINKLPRMKNGKIDYKLLETI